ncbi:DUF637 domain-containing protein, partial [Serratia marcescens]
GLAAAAGQSAVTATGVAGATASSAVYGSAYAGMTSLASQVAVALVDNQGNLSKALQALGNSQTVKATATAMAIGGALAGFDQVLDANVPADKARLPVLIKDEDWSKIAQRVAGQSVISSSLNTTINGGSFKDNLTNALLANVGSQIQAEGANLIGDNGEILGLPGRSVSHAVLAGISAEIGRGDGKGAAAGALAAELAGVILGDNIIKPEEWQKKSEQQAQMARVLGAAAGAVFTGKSDGAYSGATGGENAFRYNYLSHKQQELMEKDLAAAKTPLDKALVLANWGITSHTQDGAFVAGVVSGIPVEISDTVDGLVAVASNPREAADALIALIKNDDRFSIIGESVKQEYLGRVEAFKAKYEHAGVDGAYGAGLEFGKLTMAGLGLVAGAAGAGKLGVKITTNAIKASEKAALKGPLAYVDEPFFNPYGTLSSGQVWSIKGRMKHVQLPNEGKIRFVPDSNYKPTNPLPRGPNKGYIDKFGNEWTKGPSRTKGQEFEWDVQLSPTGKAQLGWASRDGKHLNVSLDGKITHK